MELLEKIFALKQNKTTVKTEVGLEVVTAGDVVPMVHLPASSNNYFLLYRVAPGHNNFLSLSFQVMQQGFVDKSQTPVACLRGIQH